MRALSTHNVDARKNERPLRASRPHHCCLVGCRRGSAEFRFPETLRLFPTQRTAELEKHELCATRSVSSSSCFLFYSGKQEVSVGNPRLIRARTRTMGLVI